MTRDEIIKMAAEIWNAGSSFPIPSSDDVLRFAALVAAAEREACARVCDMLPMYGPDDETADWYGYALADCAKAIRARGQA